MVVYGDAADVDEVPVLACLKQINRALQVAPEMALKITTFQSCPIKTVMDDDICLFDQRLHGIGVVMRAGDKVRDMFLDVRSLTRFSYKSCDSMPAS